MNVLLTLLLVFSAPLIHADASSGDEIEELRLQRELSEKAAAYLHENEAAIQKFTARGAQEFVNDPELQKAIEDDKASFEQRQREIESILEE